MLDVDEDTSELNFNMKSSLGSLIGWITTLFSSKFHLRNTQQLAGPNGVISGGCLLCG